MMLVAAIYVRNERPYKMIIILKLLITPLFIGIATLAGRRWGPRISGLCVGLPLTSGPISLFLALQYGRPFAAHAIVNNLVGQGSFCIFCLAYALTAQKKNWLVSASVGLLAFVTMTVIWSRFFWPLSSACAILLGIIGLVTWCMPRRTALARVAVRPPRWDLPARMSIATAFVIVLTTYAALLGPQLSGLLSPFPVLGLILATFTHRQQGAAAVTRLLYGNVVGSLAFAGFFLVVDLYLPDLSIAWTYSLATLAALGISAASLALS